MRFALSSNRNRGSVTCVRLALMFMCLISLAALIQRGHIAQAKESSPVSSRAEDPIGVLWQKIASSSIQSRNTFALDKAGLDKILASAPKEFSRAESSPLVITLPQPDGTLARFSVEESPIMDPELAAQF